MKRDDPYEPLGLTWGDGATLAEIKQAYREKSLQLHPDRNPQDPQAAQKFARLQKAYQTLVQAFDPTSSNSTSNQEDWRVHIWRNSDRIAVNRTDVAGVAKKRPAPAARLQSTSGGLLGQLAQQQRPAEYLGDAAPPRSSSVGRGQSKWVKPKQYKPWKRNDKIEEKGCGGK